MFIKAAIVIIFIIINHKICQLYSKTLPTETNGDDSERRNLTRSYYRHNIFGPNTYAFGFEVNDKASGNIQFRDERGYANGSTQGSYGYLRPDGKVMITRFWADREQGYLSQSQNWEPNDEPKWQENWPTKKPNISMGKSSESKETKIVYDDKEKLNLTTLLLPVEAIKKDYGIDLNPPELEKELFNPAVLEVINGEAPLISEPNRKTDSIGFKTVNKFIPAEFPIVPFQLQHDDLKININKDIDAKPIPTLKKSTNKSSESKNSATPLPRSNNDSLPNDTFVKFNENKAEKSWATTAFKASESSKSKFNSSTQPKSITIDTNSDWYEKLIKQTRQEYLEAVH